MAENDQINNNSANEPKELVLPREILPEVIPIIPVNQRPVFPGMMIPLIISGEKMIARKKPAHLCLSLIRIHCLHEPL